MGSVKNLVERWRATVRDSETHQEQGPLKNEVLGFRSRSSSASFFPFGAGPSPGRSRVAQSVGQSERMPKRGGQY